MVPGINIFVSMPFGEHAENFSNEWTRLYKCGILPIKDIITDYDINFIRADHSLQALGLKDQVKECIEISDVVLCVLTENLNVLWEVGYSEALEKPIVFMIDQHFLENKEKRLPVLAGQPNCYQYNHVIVKESPHDENKCSNILTHIANELTPYIKKVIPPLKIEP